MIKQIISEKFGVGVCVPLILHAGMQVSKTDKRNEMHVKRIIDFQKSLEINFLVDDSNWNCSTPFCKIKKKLMS